MQIINDNWKVEKLDHDLGYNFYYTANLAKDGKQFVLDFHSFDEVLNVLLELRHVGGYIQTETGLLQIATDGSLVVIDPDSWINPGWEYGEILCHGNYLILAIVEYIRTLWKRN